MRKRRKEAFHRYAIYRTDIEPCGFDVILMDGYLTDVVVRQVREVTSDSVRRRRMVEHNYEIARKFFSYDRVEGELLAILNKAATGLAPASP